MNEVIDVLVYAAIVFAVSFWVGRVWQRWVDRKK